MIKLGASSDEWLLLHKDVVDASVPLLAQAMEPRWERGEKVENADVGDAHARGLYKFGLKYVDKTWLLDGRVCTPSRRTFFLDYLLTAFRTSSC